MFPLIVCWWKSFLDIISICFIGIFFVAPIPLLGQKTDTAKNGSLKKMTIFGLKIHPVRLQCTIYVLIAFYLPELWWKLVFHDFLTSKHQWPKRNLKFIKAVLRNSRNSLANRMRYHFLKSVSWFSITWFLRKFTSIMGIPYFTISICAINMWNQITVYLLLFYGSWIISGDC